MIDPIRAASVKGLYAQARNSAAAALVITTYMVGTAWAFTPHATILAWAAAVLALQIARQLLIRAFDRQAPPDAELDRWARYYTFHQLATGVIWSATIFLFAHPEEPITVALTLSCLYSIASGSVPGQAYNPPTLVALVVPIFAAVLVRLIATGDFGYILAGIASALYGLTMLAFCRIQAGAILDGLRIRFENAELVKALTVQKEQLTVQKAVAEDARKKAEMASLAKSQFLAAASHDLRQPLYALGLFSTSLGTLNLDEDGRVVVGNIQESVAAMESLFVGLLDVSRLDAGVVQPKLSSVSVDALFDRLSQYFHPAAVERGLDLRFRSDGEWVRSDSTLLEQVLSNLVSNALRCTTKGGVLIAARRRGEQVSLEVWDTGTGIGESDRQRIFDEFVQLDNPERDRRKGLGLGLSIAQRSAALLGSRVELSSRLGRGSRFRVMQPSAAPSVARPSIETQHGWNGLKKVLSSDLPILIVDDDRDVRTALGDLLTRWGVCFDLAIDANEAMVRVESGKRYGLVLADYRLPGARNGLDLIAAITQRHDATPPACVLVTGDFDPDLIGAAHDRGVPLFHKPLRADKLRALLGLSDAG